MGTKAFTLADNRAILKALPIEREQQKHLHVDVEQNVDDEDMESLMNFLMKKEEPELPDGIIMPKGAL